MPNVIVLGSTGSIGTQTLDIIRRFPDRFQVIGLAAGGANLDLLSRQVREFAVPAVAVADPRAAATLAAATGPEVDIRSGQDAIANLAGSGDRDTIVVNGITGGIGLSATLAALHSGARLALANKESLVEGGALVAAALAYPGQIVPVDSEHCAIAQALASGRHYRGLCTPTLDGTSDVNKLIITASGGPFRGRSASELAAVTPAQALNHPTWSMGPVVTINSATLVNKALEIVEAHWLFDIPIDAIEPVVHPQSVIHSLVEFRDGSTIAQASPPDMRIPIALGLSWPQRLPEVAPACDFTSPLEWTFEPVDHTNFQAITVVKDAVKASPAHPCVYNAANEACVAAFLAGKLRFDKIVATVARVCAEFPGAELEDTHAVARYRNWATARTEELIG